MEWAIMLVLDSMVTEPAHFIHKARYPTEQICEEQKPHIEAANGPVIFALLQAFAPDDKVTVQFKCAGMAHEEEKLWQEFQEFKRSKRGELNK